MAPRPAKVWSGGDKGRACALGPADYTPPHQGRGGPGGRNATLKYRAIAIAINTNGNLPGNMLACACMCRYTCTCCASVLLSVHMHMHDVGLALYVDGGDAPVGVEV